MGLPECVSRVCSMQSIYSAHWPIVMLFSFKKKMTWFQVLTSLFLLPNSVLPSLTYKSHTYALRIIIKSDTVPCFTCWAIASKLAKNACLDNDWRVARLQESARKEGHSSKADKLKKIPLCMQWPFLMGPRGKWCLLGMLSSCHYKVL